MWNMDRTGETFETGGRRPRTPGASERGAARGMTLVHRLAVGIACLLVLAPRLVPALELGPIDTRSALYEPLDARIPIRDARSGDLQGLNVVLGSPAQFELAGVARLHHLDLLQFIVVEQGDGGGYIHVRTEEPIIEPSLTFLIDVDWPRGRTVRGYRLHLSAAASRAADASPEPRAAPEEQAEPETGAATTASGENRYGPVRPAETLWSIASRLRPDRSVSVQRMMLAIVEANPDAFVIGNINGLRAGAMLRIPGRDEIGSDDPTAAIAEVQAHHSAWSERRGRTPVPAAPPTPTPEPPPADPETEPGGRIEVVAPETVAGVTGQEEAAEAEALRKELALVMEEADASRRENDELKLRLSEAEGHVRELNRLVELKNEEIAALQSDLKALSEAPPPPVPTPVEAEPPPAEQEPLPEPTPAVEAPQPAPEAAETEPTPSPAPAAEEPMPAAAPDEAEQSTVSVPAEAEPAAVAETEPTPLPFGLGALPVNPVFLVGGAGLLLLLLGVLALLRRRRASTGEDDVLEVAEASSPEEDDLLFELEAVAAELADEQDVPPRRAARDGPAAGPAAVAAAAGSAAVAAAGPAAALDGGAKLESPPGDVARPGSEGLVEERIAQLWRDEGDAVPERMVAADTGADDDASEITFDIDALTGDDADLSMRDDEADEDFDIADLADLADDQEAAPEETHPDRSADEVMDRFDRFFAGDDAGTDDAGAPGFAPDTGGGDPFEQVPEIPDDGRHDAQLATLDEQEPVDADAGTSGATDEGVAWSAEPAAGRGADFVPDAGDDIDDSGPRSQAVLDESTDGGETEQFSLEEFGEGEVQTKIDLAQVYMEMGDTESARGFLEAVLAEGDPEQQEVAREMLSRLA